MLGKAIQELNEGQEKTTEELIALRRQFKELSDELKQERLAFIEYMRESGARDQETEDDEPIGGADEEEKRDRKEGNSSLKSILLGVAALGATFALFNKELGGIPGKIAGAVLESFREWWNSRGDGDDGTDAEQPRVTVTDVAGTVQTGQVMKREAQLVGAMLERSLVAGGATLTPGSQIEYINAKGETKFATVTGEGAKGKVQVTADINGKSVTYAVDKEKVQSSRLRRGMANLVSGFNKRVSGGSAGTIVFGAAGTGIRAMQGDIKGAVAEAMSAVMAATRVGSGPATTTQAALIFRDAYKLAYNVFPEDDDPRNFGPRTANLKPVIEEALTNYYRQLGSALEQAQKEIDEMSTFERLGWSRPGGGGLDTYLENRAMSIMMEEQGFNQEYRPSGDVAIPNLIDSTFAGGPLRPEFLPANVTPAGGESAVVGDIISKKTQEAAANSGTTVFVDNSNNSKNAVSTGGGAGTSRDTVPDPTSTPSYVLDAYAQPVQN